MSDEQPPTGPQDPNPPADQGWSPPPPPGATPPSSEQPAPDAGAQPPAYQMPPASYQTPPPSGDQPPQGEPYTQPPFGQQPFGQQPFGQPYGAEGYGEQLASPPAKSKRGVALGAGALALAAVAAGGIYVASQAGDEGGKQPEALVPATAFAFAKIDLDPSADQKVAIHEFSKKFPKGPKTTSEDPVDGLLAEIFKDEKCPYETHVKPWLGKRIGIAAVPGAGGKTVPLLLIQSKDDKQAKELTAKLSSAACESDDAEADDMAGMTVQGGYVVMSEKQADVDAALAAAKKGSLESNETFKDDLAKLDGNQIVVAWADLSRSFDEISKSVPELGQIPNGITKQLKGRLVMGMHVANNYGEIYARSIGADVAAVKVAKPTNLAKLPEGTVFAATVTDLQSQIEAQLKQLGAAQEDFDSALGSVNEEFGIDVRKDLLPLLGLQTTFALGNIPTGPEDAKFGILSEVTDPAAAAAVGKKISDLAESEGVPIESNVDGNIFYLATKGYGAALKGDGGLGSTPTFTAAMGDLGDEVSAAVYVDLGQIMPLAAQRQPDAPDDLDHFSAFGMSAGKVGDDGYARMRLVVK